MGRDGLKSLGGTANFFVKKRTGRDFSVGDFGEGLAVVALGNLY